MRKMKDSGIEWIKSIPKTWDVARGKNILLLKKRSPSQYGLDDIITCFRDGEVTLRRNRREDGFTFSDKEIGYQGIKKGDIVIHGMDGFAGAIGISDSDGKGSPVLVVCDSEQNKTFIMYYLRMLAEQNVFLALATGIRERSCDLKWKKIADLLFPIPPIDEQQRIADFLEYKSAQIDSIISKEEAIIEKLKEYKLSVITEAVTKGLDPDVKMINSGIEWIGEMPSSWEVGKLGALFDFIGGYAFNSNDYIEETEYQVVRIGNVKNDYMPLNNSPVFVSKETALNASKFEIKPDYILFTMTGTKGKRDYFFTCLVKKTDLKEKRLYINQRVGAFVAKDGTYPGYYNYLLKESRILDSIFLYETGTANQGNLGIESIRKTRVQIPPVEEQRKISAYLDNICADINVNIKKREAAIEKLKEYKKSLIYEVVTGKREV